MAQAGLEQGSAAAGAGEADRRSRAAVAGHPIHPMLVPLPIGLLSAAAVADLAYVQSGDRFFGRASRWLLGGGIATALTAAPFGLVDFLTIRAARRHPEAWLHGLGNIAVIAVSAANLALRLRDGDHAIRPVGLALSGAAASMLVLTGWLGGELSYRHRIGIIPAGESGHGGQTANGNPALNPGSMEAPGNRDEPMVGVMDVPARRLATEAAGT